MNHRFAVRTMALRAQQTGRNGWYYRVLQPGSIAAGDTMRVTARPHPDWSIARVQDCLYARASDLDAARELAGLDALAVAMRTLFRRRVESRRTESFDRRLQGPAAQPALAEI